MSNSEILKSKSSISKVEHLEVVFDNLRYSTRQGFLDVVLYSFFHTLKINFMSPLVSLMFLTLPRFLTPSKPKVILDNISGSFKAGRLTAIMGPSGSGKTSLLNLLAGDTVHGRATGRVFINGKQVKNFAEIKKVSAYVLQDDIMLDTMTVKEAVFMAAKLKLPESLSPELSLDKAKNLFEYIRAYLLSAFKYFLNDCRIINAQKWKKVDELLNLLHLSKAANSIIGSPSKKGISGGEKRRTSLALALVTNPPIIFLDEPTSGLDSFTAVSVVQTLKNLASDGRTVVMSIHQPSSTIFHMFDDLCLLSEGNVIYYGPAHYAVSYFSAIGYNCPAFTNPADFFFIDVINPRVYENDQLNALEESPKDRCLKLVEAWKASAEAAAIEKASDKTFETVGYTAASLRNHASVYTQFVFLTQRAFKNLLRNPYIIWVKLIQSVIIGVFLGLTFNDVNGKDFEGQIQNRAGLFAFISMNLIMSSTIGVLGVFALEKEVFLRETAAGYYTILSYFISKILVELPFQIVIPLLQGLIIYPMVGLSTLTPNSYNMFMATIIVLGNCGTALGIFFASIFSELTVALSVVPVILLPLMLFSGLLINDSTIPSYFNWIKYISPIKFGFEGLLKNEYNGWTGSFLGQKFNSDFVISFVLGFNDQFDPAKCIKILLAMYFGLLAAAYICLVTASFVRKG